MINFQDKEVREGCGQLEATCNIGKYLHQYRCVEGGLILLVEMFSEIWDVIICVWTEATANLTISAEHVVACLFNLYVKNTIWQQRAQQGTRTSVWHSAATPSASVSDPALPDFYRCRMIYQTFSYSVPLKWSHRSFYMVTIRQQEYLCFISNSPGALIKEHLPK